MLNQFISRSIEGNKDAYVIDEKQGMVMKRFEDGIEQVNDMPSYALHHLNRLRATDSVTDETKMVFCDLTAEEIAASFVLNTDPA